VGKNPFGRLLGLIYGDNLKDIAPLKLSASKKKKWSIKKVMDNNAWIGKINMNEVFSFDQTTEYVKLWR
jgi:hypothetical protein